MNADLNDNFVPSDFAYLEWRHVKFAPNCPETSLAVDGDRAFALYDDYLSIYEWSGDLDQWEALNAKLYDDLPEGIMIEDLEAMHAELESYCISDDYAEEYEAWLEA